MLSEFRNFINNYIPECALDTHCKIYSISLSILGFRYGLRLSGVMSAEGLEPESGRTD